MIEKPIEVIAKFFSSHANAASPWNEDRIRQIVFLYLLALMIFSIFML